MTDLDFDKPGKGRMVQCLVALTPEERANVQAHAKARNVSAVSAMRARIIAPSIESLELEQRLDAEARRRAGRKPRRKVP